MSLEVLGKVKVINPEQVVTATFKKRELVVTTEEQYPQHILIEFTQDKCDLLNSYNIGDNVKVGINLRGREWVNPQGEAKYFNSIQGWNISKDESATPVIEAVTSEQRNKAIANDEEHDDLPF